MALQKVGPYEVDPKEPWKNDKLDRKKVADYLTPVIASVTQPFTISLHSPYGTGKTSFIQSWQADLRKQGYKTVYFNAWETDFSQDAFFAFMEAVQRELKSQAPNAKTANTIVEKVTEATKKGAGIVGEKALPLILRGLAKKFAGDETVQGFLSLVGQSDESVGELTGALAEEGLKSQRDAEKSRIEFRTDLSETVRSLFDESTPAEQRKVIVFVDDLDRCRPSYAIQVLEAIKHIFSVPGLLFILAIDERQLGQAVKSVYGQGIDADGYFRRFVDFGFKLPSPSRYNIIIDVFNKLNILDDKTKGEPNIYESASTLAVILSVYSDAFSLTARQLEQLSCLLNLCLRNGTLTKMPMMPILAVTAVLRVAARDELEAALASESAKDEFCKKVIGKVSAIDCRALPAVSQKSQAFLKAGFLTEDQADAILRKVTDIRTDIQARIGRVGEDQEVLQNRKTARELHDIGSVREQLSHKGLERNVVPIGMIFHALEQAGQLVNSAR